MKGLASKLQRLLISHDGSTGVQYAVLLALITIVCITAIASVSTNSNPNYQSNTTQSP